MIDLQQCAEFVARWCPKIPVTAIPYTQGTFSIYAENGEVELRIDPHLDIEGGDIVTLLLHEIGHLYRGHFSKSRGWHTLGDAKIIKKEACAPVIVSDTAEIEADEWAAQHCGGLEEIAKSLLRLIDAMTLITGVSREEYLDEMREGTPRRLALLGI